MQIVANGLVQGTGAGNTIDARGVATSPGIPVSQGGTIAITHDGGPNNVPFVVGSATTNVTLSQRVPLTGAVIVTTPQDIALLDARKGIKMFEKVGVPILGIVENMAVYCCPNCGHTEHVFGADGGKRMAEQHKVDYLGALPLNMQIRVQADCGTPTVAADPDSDIAGIYKAVARQVAVQIAQKAKDYSAKFPTIQVSKST